MSEMVVTIDDRRVTSIPLELESQLKLEPFCATCSKTESDGVPLRKCSSCKLISYCSKDCQTQDWDRHWREDECVAIKELRRRLDKAERNIRGSKYHLVRHYALTYGREAFMGRDAQLDPHDYFANQELNLFELIAGRFAKDEPFTTEYIACLRILMREVRLRAFSYESLEIWEEMKRLTHVSLPDLVDHGIVETLLKLHRDDDAVGYIQYWPRWRTHPLEELNDPSVLESNKGEYPYPCQADCRLDDIMPYIETCRQVGDIAIGASGTIITFCVVGLAIKLRHITVHRNLMVRTEAFLDSAVGQWLPADIGTAIVSFLTGGDEGATLYATQVDHANRLMDFIDEEYPHLLPAVLDPTRLPTPEENEIGVVMDADQGFDIRDFLEKFGDGAPIMETLECMLEERYR